MVSQAGRGPRLTGTSKAFRGKMQKVICTSMRVSSWTPTLSSEGRLKNIWSVLKYCALPMPDCITHLRHFQWRGFSCLLFLFCFVFWFYPHISQQLPMNIHKTASPPSFAVLLPLPHLLFKYPTLIFQFGYQQINISSSSELFYGRKMLSLLLLLDRLLHLSHSYLVGTCYPQLGLAM